MSKPFLNYHYKENDAIKGERIVTINITLNQAKILVRELVKKQGFPNDKGALTQKLLWAFTELGEATDAYKKGADWPVVVEELVDVLFYILDFVGLVEQEYSVEFDLDRIFAEKWYKNMNNRPFRYGQRREI